MREAVTALRILRVTFVAHISKLNARVLEDLIFDIILCGRAGEIIAAARRTDKRGKAFGFPFRQRIIRRPADGGPDPQQGTDSR